MLSHWTSGSKSLHTPYIVAIALLTTYIILPYRIQQPFESSLPNHEGRPPHGSTPPFPFPPARNAPLSTVSHRNQSKAPVQAVSPKYEGDRLVAFGTDTSTVEDDLEQWDFSRLNYTIILPTYVNHFDVALSFIRSLRCLCADINEIEIAVILSDSTELTQFRDLLEDMESCGSRYDHFPLASEPIWNPRIRLFNFYDFLPLELQAETKPDDTSSLLEICGKYKYQSLKKLLSARDLRYDAAIWIDSEAIAVQPFSFRPIFSRQLLEPVIWHSRHSLSESQQSRMRGVARVLGRSLESFGERYWAGVENLLWYVDPAIIKDMFNWIEAAHGKPFEQVFLEEEDDAPFEVTMYHMHIHGRKLETNGDSLVSRYRVLEVEREMIRWGLGESFHAIPQAVVQYLPEYL